MKKGKIATLAAFCALFAALCLTACGDEGKENTTPLPTNTAVQTETAKPTENPTEVPTAEPTAVPTERPLLVKNYVPVKAKKLSKEFCLLDDADANGFEIDEALAYKILQTMVPDDDKKYIPYNGMWVPEGTRERDDFVKYIVFDYIECGDNLLVISTVYGDNLVKKAHDLHSVFTLTQDGEVVNTLWNNKDFNQFASDVKWFTYGNKLYFAIGANPESVGNGTVHKYSTSNEYSTTASIYFPPLWIFEFNEDETEFLWDESILSQYKELLKYDMSKDAVYYEFNNDGIDFYLSDRLLSPSSAISSNPSCEFTTHLSFKQLIDDLNSGLTKREEAKLSEEDLLEYKMFRTIFPSLTEFAKQGNTWKNPRDYTEGKIVCEFYYMEDYIFLYARASAIMPTSVHEREYTATFTLDGELIKQIISDAPVRTSIEHDLLFFHEEKLYIASLCTVQPNVFFPNNWCNYFAIREVKKDGYETAWSESQYLPKDIHGVTSEDQIKDCEDAYAWEFSGDGADLYFFNNEDRGGPYTFIKHYSFAELLAGADFTKDV
ncbi:MAG: PT domain-containing protein [Clostridia bacterium]|nr:PT domain-containing protein [Clostridia bacterium]